MHRYGAQSSTGAKNKIIVPLDVPTAKAARELIKAIGGTVGFFKVGNQLFASAGPEIVQEVRASGSKVFLDLKYHDIPNTVRHAVESASALGVDMLTIHFRISCESAGARYFTRALWCSIHDSHSGNPPHMVGVGRPEADIDSAAGS